MTTGRSLAGLALVVCAAACDGTGAADEIVPPSQGEEAALADAETMLDAREPLEREASRSEAEPPEG